MSVRPQTHRLRRIVLRAAVAAVSAGGMVVATTPAASADTGDQLLCSAGGAITIVHNTTTGLWDWVLSGVGACTVPGKPAQVRQVTLVGTAATTGLGLCTNSPFIDAFSMHIAATFVSLASPAALSTVIQDEVWALPETTFPIVSPFTVSDTSGNPIGAGELMTHIFVRCPPDGQPTMLANWVQPA